MNHNSHLEGNCRVYCVHSRHCAVTVSPFYSPMQSVAGAYSSHIKSSSLSNLYLRLSSTWFEIQRQRYYKFPHASKSSAGICDQEDCRRPSLFQLISTSAHKRPWSKSYCNRMATSSSLLSGSIFFRSCSLLSRAVTFSFGLIFLTNPLAASLTI